MKIKSKVSGSTFRKKMHVCSSCFRGCGLFERSSISADTSFDNSVVKNSSPTKFYCCGTVPPVGIYRKRHGMFEGNSFEKELPEFAVEALENDSQGFTRIVEPVCLLHNPEGL